MDLKREIHIGIGALVVLNLLTAFGAIGLLNRMTPAIGRIIQENAVSIEAGEEMLAIIALTRGPSATSEPSGRFLAALDRARRNITEKEEVPLVESIERHYALALAGDSKATQAVVEALVRLGEVNGNAMRLADEDAKRLGTAGAWAVVLLALATFVFSLRTARRFQRRVLVPLGELNGVIEASRRGDRHRRCRPVEAPVELARLMLWINARLDEGQAAERVHEEVSGDMDRAMLLHLLDERPESIVVVDRKGAVVAANRQGLSVLNAPESEGLRAALLSIPSGGSGPQILRTTPVRDADLWLCVLQAPAT